MLTLLHTKAQRKPSINASCYFSHVDFLICALLYIPSFSTLVQSLFKSFYNHLLASVLPSPTISLHPHIPYPLLLPEWNHSHHISLIHPFNKYVLGVYSKPHTCGQCLHDQFLCQLGILSQLLSLVYLFTSVFYSPRTTVGVQ